MPTRDDGVLVRFDAPDGRRAVLLEDDGKVAYAYLLESERIVGDVWLYNVGEDPIEIVRDPSLLPFCNPKRYCTDEVLPRIRPDSRVVCEWSEAGVTISIEGEIWARLEHGSKPGWSRKARIAGPIAKPLLERDDE